MNDFFYYLGVQNYSKSRSNTKKFFFVKQFINVKQMQSTSQVTCPNGPTLGSPCMDTGVIIGVGLEKQLLSGTSQNMGEMLPVELLQTHLTRKDKGNEETKQLLMWEFMLCPPLSLASL